jgi:hypothetical protein
MISKLDASWLNLHDDLPMNFGHVALRVEFIHHQLVTLTLHDIYRLGSMGASVAARRKL